MGPRVEDKSSKRVASSVRTMSKDLCTGDRVMIMSAGGHIPLYGIARFRTRFEGMKRVEEWIVYDKELRGRPFTTLRAEDEGERWARGWDTPEANALRVACAL